MIDKINKVFVFELQQFKDKRRYFVNLESSKGCLLKEYIINLRWFVLVKIFSIFFLLLTTNGYGQASNEYQRTFRYDRVVAIRDLMNFYMRMGLKANTEGGRVEVRVYREFDYNFDGERDNQSFLMGFYSESSANESDLVKTEFEVPEYYPAICFSGENSSAICGSVLNNLDMVSSADRNQIKKRVNAAFVLKQLSLGVTLNDGDFKEITKPSNKLKVVVEIDYNLPRDFNTDFTFELHLPGLDPLKHEDFINDSDNDGINDFADRCNETPLFFTQWDSEKPETARIDLDSSSERYGCAIVPKDVQGTNILLGNQWVGSRVDEDGNTITNLLISHDRAVFFSPKYARFRTYEAKYYDEIINENLPEGGIDEVPFLYDLIADLGTTYDIFSVEDDDIDIGGIVGPFIKFDPDNFGGRLELDFFYDSETERGGIKLKQVDLTFKLALDGLIDDTKALFLNNFPNGKLFFTNSIDEIANVVTQDISQETSFLLGNYASELGLSGLTVENDSFLVGITDEIAISQLTADCEEEDASCATTMDIGEDSGDPLDLKNPVRPTVKALVSENNLYKFSLPGWFVLYDFQERFKWVRQMAWSLLGTGVTYAFALIVAPELLALYEAVEAATAVGEAVATAAEGVDAALESAELIANVATISSEEALGALESGLEDDIISGGDGSTAFNSYKALAQKATQAYENGASEQYEVAVNDANNAFEDFENSLNAERISDETLESFENYKKARVRTNKARSAFNHARINSSNYSELEVNINNDAAQLQQSAANSSADRVSLSTNMSQYLKNMPARTLRSIGKAPLGTLGSLTAIGLGSFATEINNQLKRRKLQSINAQLVRNFPSILFSPDFQSLNRFNFNITENMIPEDKAPTLDHVLNGDHLDTKEVNEILKTGYNLDLLGILGTNVDDPLVDTIIGIGGDGNPYIVDQSNMTGSPDSDDWLYGPLDGLGAGDFFKIEKLLRKWDRTHCPSYHARFSPDGEFELLRRDKYYHFTPAGERKNKCHFRRHINPNEVHDNIVIKSTTGGKGKRALVSNFGNLIVEGEEGCALWDIFSQDLEREFPDFTYVTLNAFLPEQNRKKYLIENDKEIDDANFINALKAGDGFATGSIIEGAFVLMRNGKSALLYQGKANYVGPDGSFLEGATLPYATLFPKWHDSSHQLNPTKEMVLQSNGDLITTDCDNNTLSTIQTKNSGIVDIFKERYGDLFVGLDSRRSSDEVETPDDADEEIDIGIDVGDIDLGVFLVDETATGTNLILYSGSGNGNSNKLGLPIFSYTTDYLVDDINNEMNPFPLFDVNPQDGKSIITSSEDTNMEIADFFISSGQLALVREVYGKGISLYTRCKNNRSEWNTRELISEEQIIANGRPTTKDILRLINPYLQIQSGHKYELLDNGELLPISIIATDDASHEALSNEYIGGLFSHNLDDIVTHRYLISENGNYLATAKGNVIVIYEKNTDGEFIFDYQNSVLLGGLNAIDEFDTNDCGNQSSNNVLNSIDTYFFVDERGGLKLMRGSKQIVFESTHALKATPKQVLDGGATFKLKLDDNGNLLVIKTFNGESNIMTTYNKTTPATEFLSYEDLFDTQIKLDSSGEVNHRFFLFAHDYLANLDDDPTIENEIDYLTFSDDTAQLYCRATVYKGEFYLEETVSGKVLWRLDALDNHPFEEKNIGDRKRYRVLQNRYGSNNTVNGFQVVDHISIGSGGLGEDELIYDKVVNTPQLNYSQSLRIARETNAEGDPMCALQLTQIGSVNGIPTLLGTPWSSNPNNNAAKKNYAYTENEAATIKFGEDVIPEALIESISLIEVFPNPAQNGELNIIAKYEDIWRIDIVALNGNLLKSIDKKISKTNSVKIDINYLVQGLYLLKFYREDGSIIESKKLIVD